MPRKRKPARLVWHPKDGEWIIHDGEYRGRTGCRDAGDRKAAERALIAYLTRKTPEDVPRNAAPDEVKLGRIVELYTNARIGEIHGVATLANCIGNLAPFWGELTPDDVTGDRCRDYSRSRAIPREVMGRDGKPGRIYSAGAWSVRRELGVLQAAMSWAVREGVIRSMRDVTLPKAGKNRKTWLTATDATWLLHAARGGWDRGRKRRRSSHLQRFILLSLASGRRSSAVLELQWRENPGGGWIDQRRGVADFRDPEIDDEGQTRKPRGACALPQKLLGHVRRWRRIDGAGASHIIMYRGAPIREIDTAFNAACRRAERLHAEWVGRTGADVEPLDLSDVSIHTLKHTAVTWFFQAGGTVEDAEDYFTTSRRTLEEIYKAHSPAHQVRAREIANRRGRNAG